MTLSLLFSLFGGAGFLAGMAGLLQFLNTRRSTRDKSSADAYLAWRSFMTGAVDDAAKVHAGLMTERDRIYAVRSFLIELVHDALMALREHGARPEVYEPFQDRLDDIRAL